MCLRVCQLLPGDAPWCLGNSLDRGRGATAQRGQRTLGAARDGEFRSPLQSAGSGGDLPLEMKGARRISGKRRKCWGEHKPWRVGVLGGKAWGECCWGTRDSWGLGAGGSPCSLRDLDGSGDPRPSARTPLFDTTGARLDSAFPGFPWAPHGRETQQ